MVTVLETPNHVFEAGTPSESSGKQLGTASLSLHNGKLLEPRSLEASGVCLQRELEYCMIQHDCTQLIK